MSKYLITINTTPENVGKILALGTLVHVEPVEPVQGARTVRRRKNRQHFGGSIAGYTNAKKLIVETVRSAEHPVPRRDIVRAMRAHGFSKGSTGPLCHELKATGVLANPQRGFWALKANSHAG